MKKRILAFSIIAVSVVIFSSFSSVIGKLSSDVDFIEVTTEFCGVDGINPHTVRISKNDVKKIKNIFDNLQKKLEKVKTEEETLKNVRLVIYELDKYGLLGKLSVKQAENLIINKNVFQNLDNNVDLNFLCLFIGKSDFAVFLPPTLAALRIIIEHYDELKIIPKIYRII